MFKTLEVGMILAELIRRGRGERIRILIVMPHAVLVAVVTEHGLLATPVARGEDLALAVAGVRPLAGAEQIWYGFVQHGEVACVCR